MAGKKGYPSNTLGGRGKGVSLKYTERQKKGISLKTLAFCSNRFSGYPFFSACFQVILILQFYSFTAG
jgi:hypothetical protein